MTAGTERVSSAVFWDTFLLSFLLLWYLVTSWETLRLHLAWVVLESPLRCRK